MPHTFDWRPRVREWLSHRDSDPIHFPRFQRRTLRGFLLLVSLALAVTTGLGELYFSADSFGTWWNYLTAFTWGFATRAVVETLYSVLNQIKPRAAS